jgi:hypothetical protein
VEQTRQRVKGGKLMAEMFQTIAALMWMALSVVAFIGIRKWNKSFSDLYERIKSQLVDEEES